MSAEKNMIKFSLEFINCLFKYYIESLLFFKVIAVNQTKEKNVDQLHSLLYDMFNLTNTPDIT